jgi:hypothetical protein
MLSVRTIKLDHDGRIDHADFGLVSAWFLQRGGEPPFREMLPTCGAIVMKDDEPAGAGFLYMDATGSGMAWLSWLVTNPNLPLVTAGRAVVHLVEFLTEVARSNKYWCIVGNFNTPSINRLLERRGFKAGDTGATLQFKPI